MKKFTIKFVIINLFLIICGMDPSKINEMKEGLKILSVDERSEATSIILKRCRKNLNHNRIILEKIKKEAEEVLEELDEIEKESKRCCSCCDSCVLQ